MWKKIEGFENYEINENGEIKNKKGIYLKQSVGKNGYKYVALCKKSKHYTFNVHRLLAIHFLEKTEGKNTVDHIDRNRLNNDLSNLRWVNNKENANNSKNVLERKGCICETKEKYKEKIYTYYRLYYYKNNNKKSKRFKTNEEAENYQRNLAQ